MALNDNAIFTAATGHFYIGDVGTAAPTPSKLKDFDPETFGAQSVKLKTSGKITGGTFTVTAGEQTTDALPHDSDAATIQAALEKLSSVGTGNVIVKSVADGFTVSYVGEKFGKEVATSVTPSLEGGGKIESEAGDAANGWEPFGHTHEDELPEFGFEGGETESRGTWQKKNLREVATESPVDYMTLKAQQFDEQTLEMYYGKNASKTTGMFGVDGSNTAGVDKAILLIIQDGEARIGFTAAKATVRRDESISLEKDSFATLPLRATFVKHPGRLLYEWILPTR